jgi:hypothetical protein
MIFYPMEKTLIILGAGASKDFCPIFPTGLELIKEINYHFLTEKKFPEVEESHGIYLSSLMNDIVRISDDDKNLFRKIKNQLWEIQLGYEYENLRNNIDRPISIDHFIAEAIRNGSLDKKAANVIKYSIYYLIKGNEQAYAERKSEATDNWILELARKISAIGFEEFSRNLTIINFNYDRTIEKYLPSYLKEFIPLGGDQIRELQHSIRHVYNSLGYLEEVPFELPNARFEIMRKYYHQLDLVDERSEDELQLDNAELYKAVHFFGFGYDETNLKKINLKRFSSAKVHGTACKLSHAQRQDLKDKFNILTEDVSCLEYVKSLLF